MTLDEQKKYERVIRQFIIDYGGVALPPDPNRPAYQWFDYFATRHIHEENCKAVTDGKPYEDEWSDNPDEYWEGFTNTKGMAVDGVTCACGEVKDRTVRWEGRFDATAELLFQTMNRMFGSECDA